MLYTGKGDNGTTSAFGCCQRFSKSSVIAEALGTLDEINSFLGLIKVDIHASSVSVPGVKEFIPETIDKVQQNLFIAQAEIAGADKHITREKVIELETIINAVEKELPPIKSFFVSGGTELAAMLDFARTLSRRAERRVVGVVDEGLQKVGEDTLAYLNRLSSLLYALARQVNHKSGITEESPKYK
jgi:cob(I)alamin adenosyltransferase